MNISIDEFLGSADFSEDTDLLDSCSSSSEDELCTECYCESSEISNISVNEYGTIISRIEPYASNLTDIEFRKKFRVNRNTFQKVVELCGSQFFSSMDNLCEQIAPVDAVYVLLWYMGNSEKIKQMSQNLKLDECCIRNIINSGITYLSTHMHQYIEWPKSYEYPELLESFQKMSGLENVMGVVSTTNIKIQPSREHPKKFLCSRNCSCLTLQGIITFNHKFIDIFISETGKSTEIWRKSPISLEINLGLREKCFILGNESYEGLQGLVAPFPDTSTLPHVQKKFNKYLKKSLSIGTNVFSNLKGRFQRLRGELENKTLPLVVKTIQTACVLHNICIENEDDCEFIFQDDTQHIDDDIPKCSNNENSRLVVFNSFLDSETM